jgi:hypothetical protein
MGIASAASSTVCGAQGGETRGSVSSITRQERQDSSSDNQDSGRGPQPRPADPDSSDSSTSFTETLASNGPQRSPPRTPPRRSRRRRGSDIEERMVVCMEHIAEIAAHNNRSTQNDRSYSSNNEVFTDDLPYKESNKSFYMDKMPPPWNVMPRSAERESAELKLVTSTIKKKIEGTEEGKYFKWRPAVIECIHKANIALNRKYLMLTRYLDTNKSSELLVMVQHINFSPATYLNLILDLEQRYGGQYRAFSFVNRGF